MNAHSSPPQFPEDLRDELVKVFRLLGDPTRLQILFQIYQAQELNVTQLCNIIGQSQPVISHHLSMMKGSNLVTPRKEGKKNYYSVNCNQMCGTVTNMFNFFCEGGATQLDFKQYTMIRNPKLDEPEPN